MKLLYREAFASVGARLAPLTSLDEAAAFFLAAAANGPLTLSLLILALRPSGIA